MADVTNTDSTAYADAGGVSMENSQVRQQRKFAWKVPEISITSNPGARVRWKLELHGSTGKATAEI